MTADATTHDNEIADKNLRNQLVAGAGWLGGWASVCAALFSLRIGKIWNLVGDSWLGLFTAYVVLFFGGAIIVFTFSKLDRIQSEGLKVLTQMSLCLVFAIVVGGVILVLSF